MIDCEEFYNHLIEKNVDFFCGVPDSLLKEICAYIADNSRNHIITANEGNAVGLAAGYFVSTGKIAMIYMQNSGLGNAVNPLLSLADPEVYSIPMLLMVGWRGEPGIKDEPQHIKQGKITLELTDSLGIPYAVLPQSTNEAKKALDTAIETMNVRQTPYVLIVKTNTFSSYELRTGAANPYDMTREQAIKLIVDGIGENAIVVSTTGKASRELYEYRDLSGKGHENDFLTVGSMGHSSMIALGIALKQPDKPVFCLDGDGSAIMHMGALAIIGSKGPDNFKHVILNNGSHESVGSQPTEGFNIDFVKIAEACGYKTVLRADSPSEMKERVIALNNSAGPSLLEVRLSNVSRKDLGRPRTSPGQNKESFIRYLKKR